MLYVQEDWGDYWLFTPLMPSRLGTLEYGVFSLWGSLGYAKGCRGSFSKLARQVWSMSECGDLESNLLLSYVGHLEGEKCKDIWRM